MSAWIKMLSDEEATGHLSEALKRATSAHGTVDNVMRVHSLRPYTMDGHQTLYDAVLHNDELTLPIWLLELVGSYTSLINGCDYACTHHFANFVHLLDDADRADAIYKACVARRPEDALEGKELAFMKYAEALTETPGTIAKSYFDAMREAGADDGEILEVNQVCGYFNYVNRLLTGLGVTTEGDIIGYYKNE